MSNYIVFPVGDPSFDGHNYLAKFLVKSAKIVEEVRQVHFNHNGFLSQICAEYEENTVELEYLKEGCLEKEDTTEKKVNTFLNKIKKKYNIVVPENTLKIMSAQYNIPYDDTENQEEWLIDTPELMINLWIELLNWFDSSLKLKLVSEALSSYKIKYVGYPFEPNGDMDDYKPNEGVGRINLPGYGVWSDISDSEFYNDVS